MSWWTSLQDKIAENTSGWFVDEDDVDTARQVGAAQKQIIADQYDRGVITGREYAELTAEADEYGEAPARYKEEHSDVSKVIPTTWKIVAVLAVAAYIAWRLGLFSKR